MIENKLFMSEFLVGSTTSSSSSPEPDEKNEHDYLIELQYVARGSKWEKYKNTNMEREKCDL